MVAGLLNPSNNARATSVRPARVPTGAGSRRWFSDPLNTQVTDHDLNDLIAQIRYAVDFYGVTDAEGDDASLQKAIAAAAGTLTGNIAKFQALVGAADKVPYFTSNVAMSMFTASSYSRGLMAKTNATQWLDALGVSAISSPNVTAFAALTASADQVAYFTGAGAMALSDFTSFGRSLVDDLNQVAARTTLGLGSMAVEDTASWATSAQLALKANLASPIFTGVPVAPTAALGTSTTQLATTAFVQAAKNALVVADIGGLTIALDAKAPLDSPALTGTPSAPTPSAADSSTKIATTAFVAGQVTTINSALALKAPLASPALTGVPTAPTAVVATNTTQIASTAFVKLVAATLQPLASALTTLAASTALFLSLSDDTTQAAMQSTLGLGSMAVEDTVNWASASALALKAPLASPTFTGTPAAPTAVAGTNTTQLATTAFVQAAVTAGTLPDGNKGDITVASGGTVWTVNVNSLAGPELIDAAVTTAKLGPNAVANTKLAQMAALTFKARRTNSLGDPEDITVAQAQTLLGLGTAAYEATGTTGHVIPFVDGANVWVGQTSLTFSSTSTEKIVFSGAGATAFAEGIEAGALYWRANNTFRWYTSVAADGGVSDTMQLTPNILSLIYPNDNAAAGPLFDLIRDTASPAAADALATIRWFGRNSVGTSVVYARFVSTITNPTDAAEAATLDVYTTQNGLNNLRVSVGFGLYTVSRTDMGANTINATTLYEADVSLATKYGPLANANTYTAMQTIDIPTSSTALLLRSTHGGATNAPILDLDRGSASPAANDAMGQIRFLGRSNIGTQRVFADIYADIADVADGAEDGRLYLRTLINGVATTILTLNNGLTVGVATGGDKGVNTLNVQALYEAGTALTAKYFAAASVSAFGATLIDDADQIAARATLGLGSAAVQNIGTSGANVGLLNANNDWTAQSSFAFSGASTEKLTLFGTAGANNAFSLGIESGTMYFKASLRWRWYIGVNADVGVSHTMMLDAAGITLIRSVDTVSSSLSVDLLRRSTTAAVGNNLGGLNYYGNNSTNADILNLKIYGVQDNVTAGSEAAHFIFHTVQAGTAGARFCLGYGIYAASGGGGTDMGSNTINAGTLYEGSVSLAAKYAALANFTNVQFSGPTSLRTYTLPDNNATIAWIGMTTSWTALQDFKRGLNAGGNTSAAQLVAIDLDGNATFKQSNAGIVYPLTLLNSGINAVGQGIGVDFRLGQAGASLIAGRINVLAREDYSVAGNRSGQMVFQLNVDNVTTDILTLNSAALTNTLLGTLNITGALSTTTSIAATTTITAGGHLSTIGGDLIVDRTGDSINADVFIKGDAGQTRTITWNTGANARFAMRVTNVAEAGADAGSGFQFIAYSDAGASLGTIFTVVRATRVLSFTVIPLSVTPLTADNSVAVATTAWVKAQGYTVSDIRLKDNLHPISDIDVRAILNELQPMSFTWKDSGIASHGLIAQDVDKIQPDFVRRGSADGSVEAWSLDYGRLSTYAIAGSKLALSELEVLKQRVEALEEIATATQH